MTVLEKLRRTLSAVNKGALSRIRPGDALQLHNEQALLRAWVKGGAQLEQLPQDGIDQALRAYRLHKNLKGLRQVRLVCHGCTQGGPGERLIENRELFAKLLEYAAQYTGRHRTFRKLYRALLNGYFSYDAEQEEGRRNRERLRAFLADHLAAFEVCEFTPLWLLTLIKYPQLLGERPGQVIEATFLKGDWSVFNEICQRLELDHGSWLIRRLVMAQFSQATDMDDAGFMDHLDSLLLFLNDFPLYAAPGLRSLLDRYVDCKSRDVYPALRDFAVNLWGNPWLAAHQWQCGERARNMLAHWLRRQLLADFFSILSNDDREHPRRFDFWDLYCEDMTGMYFALGSDAYARGNMALYEFRHQAKGLIARLTEEKHGVHTCIMQFAHYHVVEFNRQNNVAYFYDTRLGTPSFYFAKGWLDIGAISVKDVEEGADVARTSKPLRHQDSRELAWEGVFAREMGSSVHAIEAFCRKYQCSYEKQGDGSERIRVEAPDRYGMEVWSVLAGWGYSYSASDRLWLRLTYPALN